MTITARNIGRINVWPTYDVAREADTEDSKYTGQLTVWRTTDEARANTSHEEGGGDDAPLIFIDFVNNVATNDGATVAIDTLVGSDPNTDAYWGPTVYEAAALSANGYDQRNATDQLPPALIGAARTLVLAGATVVWQIFDAEVGDFPTFAVMSNTGDIAVYCELGMVTGLASGTADGSGMNFGLESVVNTGDNTYNGIALTYVPETRLDLAVNNAGVNSGMLTGDDGPLHAVLFDVSGFLRSIAIYPPLPDTSGLSELSEI